MPPPSPRMLPTVGTVQLQAEINTGLIKALRKDIEELHDDIDTIKRQIVTDAIPVRFSPVPSSQAPAASTPVPRPSVAARAALGTTRVGTWLMLAMGAVSFAGQVIARWKPQYQGPISQALELLKSLADGQ